MKFFPVTITPAGEKIPLIKGWQTLASDDPAQLAAWQQEFGARISVWGVPTGKASGLFVLDVDGPAGFETLRLRGYPQTLSQRTLKGGLHLIFSYPNDGKHYGNRVKFLPGLDTRGEGGFIAWYGTATTEPIAPPPDWLLQELAAREKPPIDPSVTPVGMTPAMAQRTLEDAWSAVKDASPGEANNTLNVQSFVIGQLVRAGSIDKDYAEKVLLHAASLRSIPSREAKATIDSGLKGGAARPLTSPFGDAPPASLPLPETPDEWIPQALTEYDLKNTAKLKKPQLFKDWSTEDISLTTADGGTGKTTLKLTEAACLALGIPFLGFDCVNPGGTLYITGEDDTGKLAAMLGRIAQELGVDKDPELMQRLIHAVRIKTDTELCLIERDRAGFYKPSINAINKLLRAVEVLKPKMVVLDPISSFWGSETALNDMAQAVRRVAGRIVDQGVCFEMINHMGKSSSQSKDQSQFAGRGGTGLPSHSRVSRALTPLSPTEYLNLTNEQLEPGESAILCTVNKFSDGSPLLGETFIIIRHGYSFRRRTMPSLKQRESEQTVSDVERVVNWINEETANYPTEPVVIGHFMLTPNEPMSEARVKRALKLAEYQKKIRRITHPDATEALKAYEIIKGNYPLTTSKSQGSV